VTDRPKIPPCAAIILAGGLNSRMGGRNKAFLQVDGKAILDRLVSVLSPIFDEILLVTRQPDCYAGQSLKIVTDLYEDRSSLTGIHAGLINAASPMPLWFHATHPFSSRRWSGSCLKRSNPNSMSWCRPWGVIFNPCALFTPGAAFLPLRRSSIRATIRSFGSMTA
jgi:hypothetical protein